jgi:hypothetical protein
VTVLSDTAQIQVEVRDDDVFKDDVAGAVVDIYNLTYGHYGLEPATDYYYQPSTGVFVDMTVTVDPLACWSAESRQLVQDFNAIGGELWEIWSWGGAYLESESGQVDQAIADAQAGLADARELALAIQEANQASSPTQVGTVIQNYNDLVRAMEDANIHIYDDRTYEWVDTRNLLEGLTVQDLLIK